MTALTFVKAMAYFRGSREISLEDVRQILPFVLHDKLVQESDSPFFEAPGNARLPRRPDQLDPQALRPVLRRVRPPDLDRDDPVAELERRVRARPGGRGRGHGPAAAGEDRAARSGVGEGTQALRPPLRRPLKLKYLHQRYTNYLRWLTWKG